MRQSTGNNGVYHNILEVGLRTGFLLLVLLSFLIFPAAPVSAAVCSVSAVPSAVMVRPGGSFDVSIRVSTDTPTRGMQFAVSWDPALASCSSADRGSYYTDFASANAGSVFWFPGAPVIDNVNGRFPLTTPPDETVQSVAVTGAPGPGGTLLGVTGEGDVYILHMIAKNGVNGSLNFNLSLVQLGDNSEMSRDLQPVIVNGQVEVAVPAVATTAAADVAATQAVLNGNLLSLGAESNVEVSFEYGVTTDYGYVTVPQSVGSAGLFDSLISGLAANTLYHFRAKAAAGSIVVYGDDQTFTTTPDGRILWAAQNSGTAETLTGVWGSGSNDVFAVGTNGTILHSDGTAWSAMSSGASVTLEGVWGSRSDDVFVVGHDGVILHYDGIQWTIQDSGVTVTLTGVWGSSSSDVFAVGLNGAILHYNGTIWSPMNSGTTTYLFGIWGSSATDVFVVGGWIGTPGTILHYNGTAWSSMSSGTPFTLTSIWGFSSADVFAAGMGGTIIRYNGSAWSAMNSGTSLQLEAIWGRTPQDVYAVGGYGTIVGSVALFDGSAWNNMNTGTSNLLNSVGGVSASDVYAVGDTGTILYLNTPALTLAVDGGGSTTPAAGVHSYLIDAVVTLNAIADQGWQFDSWTGSVSSPESAQTTVIMGADQTVTAHFVHTEVYYSDVNADGICNVLDLIMVGNVLMQTGTPGWIPQDANLDGRVNVLDLIFLGNYINQRW